MRWFPRKNLFREIEGAVRIVPLVSWVPESPADSFPSAILSACMRGLDARKATIDCSVF